MIVLEWTAGGSGRVVETDGDVVTLLSSRSAPPGTPLEGCFDATTYRVKVRSCRRTDTEPERPFRIDGQFQNLSRGQRERILAAGTG
ncbi:MAG: hypothetical protein IPI67_33035 [Myxococcales bacterium]|nr:hypothetical protein [Myxococcales bacterium]